jgi:hypothetical protein
MMNVYTEAEARQKRAISEHCGDMHYLPANEDNTGKVAKRLCVASECMGWVWEDAEFEALHDLGRIDKREYRWVPVYHKPGRTNSSFERYEYQTVDPTSADRASGVFWVQNVHSENKLGAWYRPTQNRKGRCGRVVITTVLEPA